MTAPTAGSVRQRFSWVAVPWPGLLIAGLMFVGLMALGFLLSLCAFSATLGHHGVAFIEADRAGLDADVHPLCRRDTR